MGVEGFRARKLRAWGWASKDVCLSVCLDLAVAGMDGCVDIIYDSGRYTLQLSDENTNIYILYSRPQPIPKTHP
jgi:hypothetical protein